MTAPTGTFQTYGAIGIREDLQDAIYNIDPVDTPFMSNIGRGKASNTFHEWQTDTLEAATSANAVIEGDDATTDTATATVRLGNYTQIMDKVARVSGTQRAVNTAGRADELAYQLLKRSRELKRDIEKRLCADEAAAVGTAAGARELAGIGAWLWDNQVKQGSAQTTVAVTSGAPSTDPTAGTAGTLTEANLTSLLSDIWDDGGDPTMILVGSFNKQKCSNFAGIATQYRDNPQVGPAVIIGAADVYVSDWGTHNIVASRFTSSNRVYAIDTEYWEVAYLRPIQRNPLSKTGDSDRVQILTELTLCAKNPKSSGKIYSTTTS